MRQRFIYVTLFFFICCLSTSVFAALTIGARGGPFFEFHTSNLSAFDSDVRGNPVVVGGIGMGTVSKKVRIGGMGGGGFLFTGSDNVQFGLGYGGVVGEYLIAKWLTARLLIGGGGYSIVKIVSETSSSIIVEKISTGGFFLFYPSVNVEIPIHNWLKLHFNLGYFLPNVSKLDSITTTISLVVGRN